MLMEPAQTVEVDRAVVHPDTLQQVGGSGRPLADKRDLINEIEYVAHFPKVLFCRLLTFSGHTVGRATVTETGQPQSVVALSEKSLRALERSRRKSSFVLARPG